MYWYVSMLSGPPHSTNLIVVQIAAFKYSDCVRRLVRAVSSLFRYETDSQSHLAARQRQHCAVLVDQDDPARARTNRNACAGSAVHAVNVERRSDVADLADKIGH